LSRKEIEVPVISFAINRVSHAVEFEAGAIAIEKFFEKISEILRFAFGDLSGLSDLKSESLHIILSDTSVSLDRGLAQDLAKDKLCFCLGRSMVILILEILA
jgi:hypothetical protein